MRGQLRPAETFPQERPGAADRSPLAAGKAFQFNSRGLGADGYFSNFPADGNAVPDTVYTSTFVAAASSATKVNGTPSNGSYLLLDRFSYKYDAKGDFIPLSYSFGEATGSAVTLAVSRKLDSASTSASVPLTTCTVDVHWTETCADAGTKAVAVSWTGQGDVARANGHYNYVTRDTTSVFNFRGTFRDAIGSGQFDGTELGASRFGQIYNASYRDSRSATAAERLALIARL